MITLLLIVSVILALSTVAFGFGHGLLIGVLWFAPIGIVGHYVLEATEGLPTDSRAVLTLAALCAFGASWTRQAHRHPVGAAVWVNTRERLRNRMHAGRGGGAARPQLT